LSLSAGAEDELTTHEEELMPVFALGTTLGALLAYFFDPQNGKRRRHLLADRTAAVFRSGGRHAAQTGRAVAAEAYGVSQKVTHLKEEPKDFDDATLADKVRSEVFRDPQVPKGDINVNVQEGVVQLRGQVERPELIETLVEQTRKVQGVRDVENLLHTPGTEAPMHE
jgi:osmotically-inducible protein OsmY